MLSPHARYQALLASGKYSKDTSQAKIIDCLNHLYLELIPPQKNSFLQILRKRHKIQSYYIWGSVGRGKTWLIDLFFEALPLVKKIKKKRCHFHQFMKEIHDQLKKNQGHKNPLLKIAKDFSRDFNLLCLDEFFVSDIADAMILGELFSGFFKYHIVIVLTSNTPPDGLYKNGLQRDRFLPAIALIKKNMRLLHLESRQDYRLRALEKSPVFFCNDKNGADAVKQLFSTLAQNHEISYHSSLVLNGRPIEVKALANKIIWFDIEKLCAVPRSQMDYLCLAKTYKVVVLDNVKTIDPQSSNLARYFINLIDILYDAGLLLVLHSAVQLADIYPQGQLAFEFQRTLSRLIEMQSKGYVATALGKLGYS